MSKLAVKNRGMDEEESNRNKIGNNENNLYCVCKRNVFKGLVGTVMFGGLFIYNVINPIGSHSLYSKFGFPMCWFLLFIVCLLLLFSLTTFLINTDSLLNVR